MATFKKFEEIECWRKARELTRRIYKASGDTPFARDFSLKDQIRRASVSVMSNIAEGFERGRSSEFHQFLSIAKASCAELRSQLYVALDVGYLGEEAFDRLMSMAIEVGQIVGGLRKSVEHRRDS